MNEQVPVPEPEVTKRLGLGVLQARGFWTRSRIFMAAGAVLLVLAGGWYFSRGAQNVTYVTAQVSRGPLVVAVSATGTLQPEDQVDVGAEISGRVDKVNVDFNDHVKKGQVLAVINTDQIKAQLAQAEAALNSAKANVQNGQATVTETKDKRDRAQALLARGIMSAQDSQGAEADYQRAVAALNKARADVQNATAQVTVSQTNMNKAEVKSPIDGVVLDRKVAAGQTVAASFQTPVLFTLATDLSQMELQVDIDEADIGQVREGQAASFTVDAFPNRTFNAKLISLRNAPKTVNGVVTYQGVLVVDNSARLLRPGLTAMADILVTKVDDALLVPNGALRFTPATAIASSVPPLAKAANGQVAGRVWVLEGTKPVAHDLTIGHSDGRNTEVLSGTVAAGDKVITDVLVPRTGG